MNRVVLLSAAEISGDALGAVLARELRSLDPGLALVGLGGPRMAASGVEILADITDTSIVGFFDGIHQAPRYLRAIRSIRRALGERSPAAVVAIDAPGLNFPLLRAARRRGLATIYYACPQTWLWNPGGATARLRATADRVVALLPDEAALYRQAGLPTIYHGHPIVDIVESPQSNQPDGWRGADGGAIPIGLLPGSRRSEIGRLVPLMCEAANLVAAAIGPLHVRLGLSSERWAAAVGRARRLLGPQVTITQATAADVLTASRVTLAASGSVLLEACLLDAPAVMTYRIDRLSYWIAHQFLRIDEKLPHYAMPNLLARERIVPELVQRDAVPALMAEAVCRLATDAGARQRMFEGYWRVRAALGEKGSTREIARDILAIL
jgi:lipid-A-disaccharide synthase